MTVRICSHRSSMQSDVLNDQQTLSNEIDCPNSTPTTVIYSGLKLHPKPLVPTISMPTMANQLSTVKKLSLTDPHGDNTTKNLSSTLKQTPSTTTTPTTTPSTTQSSFRLLTSTTGKSSPPTALQVQFFEKSSTTNGGFSASKTFIFNPQQTNSSNNSPPVVTLIPPGTNSSKLQTLISSTNDLSTTNDLNSNSKTNSFFKKNRVTVVQPIITNSSSSSSSSLTTATNSTTPKLVIQQNSTSNLWPTQSTTKILSATRLAHPVQLISHSEHSNLVSPTANENPIFTTKTLDSGHQAVIHMSLLQSPSPSESIHPVPLASFYSNPSTVLLAPSRSMDHNNNHSVTTPIVHEMTIEEKTIDSSTIKTIHTNKNSMKHRQRLPLQPSTQQISSISPSNKKHKLPEDEQSSTSEPPRKFRPYERIDSMMNEKKIRKARHRTIPTLTIENKTPNDSTLIPSTSSIGVDTTEMNPLKKRSSAQLAAEAIVLYSPFRKKRFAKKNHDQTLTTVNLRQEQNLFNDPSIEPINDELLKRLSQDFVYVDEKTGLRWIATKTRSQPMGTLLSRVSWKPKINHYEKYTDAIRMSSKRTVPVRNPDTIRKQLLEPWASWRIDRLTSYLTDLTQDERQTQMNLSDIGQLFDQLNLDDPLFQHTVNELIEDNLQRHRSFSEQLTQISSLLTHLLSHGHTLREIHSTSKLTNSIPISNSLSTTRKTKER